MALGQTRLFLSSEAVKHRIHNVTDAFHRTKLLRSSSSCPSISLKNNSLRYFRSSKYNGWLDVIEVRIHNNT